MARAVCEQCEGLQPAEWKAGDLCAHCGQSVRHEVRCYWCAKWTPFGKFCRGCGAAVLEERVFGAARMLKDAGTDRFTIPKQLAEFDPEQVENFTRIYQRHAIAVARHADELRFLEKFLRGKGWGAALEEELIPQLPWPEARLKELSGPPLRAGDDLTTARTIQETSPFPQTRELAALVRLKLQDWEAYKAAASTLGSADAATRAEAALLLTSWRVRTAVGSFQDGRAIAEELKKSPFKTVAAVRLAGYSRGPVQLPPEADDPADPDTAFDAALLRGDVERLVAALRGDELERIAAGRALARLKIAAPLERPLREGPDRVRNEILYTLANSTKEPLPALHDVLLELLESSEQRDIRERAARIYCRACPPEAVLRVARAAGDDRSILQSLLQQGSLPPDSLVELGDFLIEERKFTLNQYGLSTIAEKGLMPDTFVPQRFGRAGDDETRRELLRFAEKQLEHHGDEALHKFVLNVVFSEVSAPVRAAAWWSCKRWYQRKGEHRGEGPFKLERAALAAYAPPLKIFLPRFAALLRDADALKEVGLYDAVAHWLTSFDAETIEDIRKEERGAEELLRACLESMRGDYHPNVVEGMVRLASFLAQDPRRRDETLSAIRALGKKGNYHYDKALRRLELAVHGIPEESDWDTLPADYVPSKWASATPQGRDELLKLADHQLVYKHSDPPSPVILRFLLKTALSAGDAKQRLVAMDRFDDRARNGEEFLKPAGLRELFGSVPALALQIASLVLDPALRENRDFGKMGGMLLERLDVATLAEDAEAAQGLLAALEGFLIEPESKGGADRPIQQAALKFFEQLGALPRWRDAVERAATSSKRSPRMLLGMELDRLLKKIAPPKPAPRPVSYGTPEPDETPPPPPAEIDYVAKGKLAEQMGKDLQVAIFAIMAGAASPEEKVKESTRLSEEFQAKIKALYDA